MERAVRFAYARASPEVGDLLAARVRIAPGALPLLPIGGFPPLGGFGADRDARFVLLRWPESSLSEAGAAPGGGFVPPAPGASWRVNVMAAAATQPTMEAMCREFLKKATTKPSIDGRGRRRGGATKGPGQNREEL